jgi:hypothetical protein
MSSVKPSLEEIKQAARTIQKRDGFSYCQALEVAAKNAGFNNYAAVKAARSLQDAHERAREKA